jgi:hypothetical protein
MTNPNKMYCRMLSAGALSAALLFTAFFSACEQNNGEEPGVEYPGASAAVDYSGSDPGKAVFINFSGPTVTASLPHDFFDLAMYSIGSGQNSAVYIIANSGSYGTGVQVLKTDGTDIAADLSARKDAVTAFTFREGVELYGRQESANPLSGASGAATIKNVYLIKVAYGGAEARYYKVVFDSYGPQGRCAITVVPGAEAGDAGKVTLTAGLSGIADGYGYIYFDLHSTAAPRVLNDGDVLKPGVTALLPKAADWDLLCARTDDYLATAGPSGFTANRSSILLNTVKGVAARAAEGKYMEEVLSAAPEQLSGLADAIGWQWYQTDNRGAYWVDPVTYVVKTAEGNYAKFQPATFKGPGGENFHMDFRYYYVADDTGFFDQ